MDQQNLAALLGHLRSANNEERKAAEEQYNNIVAANPVWAMHAMAEISATAQDAGVMAMSLALLRKVLNQTPSPYSTADADSRAAVKDRMLQVLNSAANGHLRGSAAACVSALAAQVFQNKEDWSELWDNVFAIISAPGGDVHLKTMCCEIVLATSLPMSAYFKAHGAALAAGLETCFAAEAHSVDLKKAAFETTIRLSGLDMADCLRPLVPKMLGVVESYLNLGEWESVESLLEATVDGISSNIKLFQNDAQHLLELMMQVAAAPQVDSGARHMAVELMLTYCEEVPKTVRKVPQFATSFFELLFQYTLNPEYNKEWDTTGRDNDEDDLEGDSDLIIGSSGLDRISNALGGRKLQKTAQELFANNINAPEWQRRNAAVLLICYAGEGMRAVFAQQLPSLVQMVVPHVKDESKYVRANTLDCIAQLSQDFTPELQMKLHAAILPAVVAALRDSVPRVASCAANCLDSFIDSVSGDEEEEDDDGLDEFRAILQPYIEPMCGDCVAMLSTTEFMFVREAALGVLSSVSSTCKSLLLPYVQSLVPIYQHVLTLPDSPEVMKTKCKAIECVTLLACGVGRDAFAAYSADVCNYLSNLCKGGLANDDPRTRFVMRGWTCMVECLKDQAQPYLGTVIPILLNMMSMECDMEIANIGVGEDDAEDGDQPEGVEKMRFVIPGVGERVVTIHTSLIEDKELASNVVFAMLKDLGVGLAPYFRDIANAGIGQLAFVVSDSIRESGASIIDEILKCYEEMRDPAAQQLAEAAMPKLMDALGDESENSVMEVMLQSIGRCVGVHPAIMSPTNTALVCDKVMATLEVVVKRRNECLEKKATENDEDELDELEVEDEEVQVTITSVCDLIGTLLMASKEVFAAPFLAKAFPIIGMWLQAPSDEFYMTRATSLLSDFVANAPQSIVPSLPAICESALKIATATSDDALLQSDFFLMNMVVQLLGAHPETNMGVNGADFAVHVQQTVAPYWSSNLVQDETYTHTTCNALSLYVSLLDFYGTTALQQAAAGMLAVVGEALPAKDDEIEARRIHDVVLRWVTNHHPVLQAVPEAASGFMARLKSADSDCLSEAAQHYISTL